MGHSFILMELTVSWGGQHIIQYRSVVELQPWDSGNRVRTAGPVSGFREASGRSRGLNRVWRD